jgi:hypothetical protein
MNSSKMDQLVKHLGQQSMGKAVWPRPRTKGHVSDFSVSEIEEARRNSELINNLGREMFGAHWPNPFHPALKVAVNDAEAAFHAAMRQMDYGKWATSIDRLEIWQASYSLKITYYNAGMAIMGAIAEAAESAHASHESMVRRFEATRSELFDN